MKRKSKREKSKKRRCKGKGISGREEKGNV